MKGRPDDWTPKVRKNWKHVTAYIVSSHHPSCLKMAKDEVAFINRNMQHVPLDEVPSLSPPLHWFMAVIVCPGDDLTGLAEWARGVDLRRIHFYLHASTATEALAPWSKAKLSLARVNQGFTSYGQMHQELGLDLSDVVYGDF